MAVRSATIVEDLVKDLRNFLEDNLTDPISSSRSTSKWVLLAYPHYRVQYPIVIINQMGQRDTWASLGTEYKIVTIELGIEVWSNSNSQRDSVWDDVYDELRHHFTTADTSGNTVTGYNIYDLNCTNAFNMDQPEEKLHKKLSTWTMNFYAT